MPLPEGEEFKQFAGEVLIGLPRDRARSVKIDQHRWIAGDFLQESAEVSQCLPAKQLVLPVQRRHVPNLLQR